MTKIEKLKISQLDFDDSFALSQECLDFLTNTETYHLGYEFIIYALEYWSNLHFETHQIWTDIVEKVGFYPYLEKYKEKLQLVDIGAQIRKEYYVSERLSNIYLHDEQKYLLEKIKNKINLIISAPTSFGKSLLIEEIVAEERYQNIVVIQPTLALLDETRRKLQKYSDKYKIIVRTSQKCSREKGNIFLFTAERVLEYLDFPQINFLVIDEFYKLSANRDDERSDMLNNAFYKMLKRYSPQFLLLGPNIEGISDGFIEKYSAEFYKTRYSLVVNEEIDYYTPYLNQFGKRGSKKLFKEKVLFKLLYELKEEQTIIFCSSPTRVRELAQKYMKHLENKQINGNELDVIEWINQNISSKWFLSKALSLGIGIHDGALPKHITSSIINYYNEKLLRCVFCTTTIIEGVNTNSKNIIYYDDVKGKNVTIDFFDYSNIKGRAGRMMEHFIGKIYNFNKPPVPEQIIIDIPFYEQNPVTDEVLIHIEKTEVKESVVERYKKLQEIPEDLREIIKKNGVSISGQLKIVECMMNENDISLINWVGYPTYEQLTYIIGLAWDHLLKPTETTNPMTKKALVFQVNSYMKNKKLKHLFLEKFKYYKVQNANSKKSDDELINMVIRDVLQVVRHWFEYKVPKWLNVLHTLQEYVCNKRDVKEGSYIYFSQMIENSFLQDNLILLSEYNIPMSALHKMQVHIPANIAEDGIVDFIINNNLIEQSGLIDYEKNVIIRNLGT